MNSTKKSIVSKRNLKNMAVYVFLLFCTQQAIAQTALSAGDVLCTGFNSGTDGLNNKYLQFVILKNVAAGTTFKISGNTFMLNGISGAANGWLTRGGVTKWTAPSGGVTAGTVVNITLNSGTVTANVGSVAALPASCGCADGSQYGNNNSGGKVFIYSSPSGDGSGVGQDFSGSSGTVTFWGTPISLLGYQGTTSLTTFPTTWTGSDLNSTLRPTSISDTVYLANGARSGQFTNGGAAFTFASVAAAKAAVLDRRKWTTSVAPTSFTATNFTIGAVPSFTGATSLSVCQNSTANSINANLSISDASATGTVETWTIVTAPAHGALSGFTTTTSLSSGSATPTGCTYTPTSGYTGTDAFVIRVSNGTNTATRTINITVNAAPSVAAISGGAPSTFCPGTSFTATDATAGGVWTSSASGVASVNATGVVTAVTGGVAYISYTLTNSCGTVSATPLYVRVTPTPLVGPIYGSSSVCTGSSITLTDSVGAGNWFTSTPSVATINGSGVVTGISAGTAIISFESTNACGTRRTTKTITVGTAAAVAAISGGAPSTFCPGTTFTASDATAGGVWTSSASGVATVNATGVVTAVSGGVAYISYTVTSSCGAVSATPLYVRVTPTPIVGPIYGASSVCAGSAITLTDSVGAGNWFSSTPSVATIDGSGVVTGIAAGTATISFENTNACGTRRATKTITVGNAAAVAAISGSTSIAVGSSTTLTDVTSGGVWSSSTSSIATISSSGIVTGIATGVATITYLITTGCGAAYATTYITVGSVSGSSYNISTIAGTGTAGYNGEGAVATANLNYPYASVKDAAGNLYIADHVNHRVRKINAAGVISTIAGNGGAGYSGDGGAATAAALNLPTGVLVDASGNVYITDCYNGRIRKVSTSGIITTVAGGGTGLDGSTATAANLYRPTSICFDASGNMYIAETGNHKVRKINTSGVISTFAGTGVSGFNGDGAGASTKQLSSPICVVADGSGNVYISDLGNNLVRKVNTLGAISSVAGTGTAGYSGDGGAATAARIHSPYGLALDAYGNIYFCDFDNYGIRKVSTTGIITTFAGNATNGFSGDGGWATAASLSRPTGVSLDAAGNVYIADQYNHRIRKVTLGCLAPSAGTISGPSTVIIGNSITLTNTVSGGTWSSVSPSLASISATGVVRGVAAGTDTIKYTVSNACGTSRAVYVIRVTASRPGEDILAAAQASLNVYPNPSTGLLTIETQQDKTISTVIVFDLSGKVVLTTTGNGNSLQVDMSTYAPGLYIFKVAYADGQVDQVRVVKD